MVLLNTNPAVSSIDVKYLIEVPRRGCIFCSTRERDTGRTRLFLFFRTGKVYTRRGLSRRWAEVDSHEAGYVRGIIDEVLHNHSVPHYTSNRIKLS